MPHFGAWDLTCELRFYVVYAGVYRVLVVEEFPELLIEADVLDEMSIH